VLAALGALTRAGCASVAVLVDILIAFPVLLIAMMLSSVWGGSLWVVIVSVGIGFGVNIARVTRRSCAACCTATSCSPGAHRGSPRCRTCGGTCCRTSRRCSSCSCRGAWRSPCSPRRAQLPRLRRAATEPSWGLLLKDLQTYISVHPLSVVWPGLAITITVLGLNLLGDGLREATDPTLSRRRTGAAGAQPAVIA
jgi:peptide/nickel transport system permease protein